MENILYLIIGLTIGAMAGWLIARAKSVKTISSLESDKKMLQREIQLIQEQQAKDDAARDRHYQEQLRMAQEQLKNATAELLTARTQELNRNNASQMNSIIDPLKEKIKEMQAAMDSSREQSTRNSATLHQAIEEIMKRTASIGDGAGSLANALRH